MSVSYEVRSDHIEITGKINKHNRINYVGVEI